MTLGKIKFSSSFIVLTEYYIWNNYHAIVSMYVVPAPTVIKAQQQLHQRTQMIWSAGHTTYYCFSPPAPPDVSHSEIPLD